MVGYEAVAVSAFAALAAWFDSHFSPIVRSVTIVHAIGNAVLQMQEPGKTTTGAVEIELFNDQSIKLPISTPKS